MRSSTPYGICLILILAIAAVYYQVPSFSFVNFDDPQYVQQNPYIKNGLTPSAVKWAFTTGYACFWHPLTWLSHALDWQLFGSNPAGHHLASLVFHIVNTLLLFLVLKQMTKTLWPSAFTAALFALHPLHVESVAWVSERKDVLSTFFWMLTMWAYVRYVRRPKVAGYLLIVVFLALGLMAKPMLVTLPFVLLLLDYWPLDRVSLKREKTGTKHSRLFLLIEKIPLFAIALASCLIAFIAQKQGRGITSGENFTFPVRLANASISYMQYIIKMIWPTRMAMFYPHPGRDVSILYAVISGAVLLSVTVFVIRFSKNHRYLFTGWFWYVGTLVPVIGIVQVGRHAMADRYSYVTLTGLFIIIAWGMPKLLEKLPYRKVLLWTSSLVVLSGLAVCAHIQQRYWKNTITLCEHALKVTDNNYRAHYCITLALIQQGRFDEAIWHSSEAIRINPDCYEAYNNLGLALCRTGRMEDAIQTYQEVLKIKPDLAISHGNLAAILEAKGAFTQAVEHCRIALKTMDNIPVRKILGNSLLKLGRLNEAITEYRKVLSVVPDDADALNKLGYALGHSGEFDEAISVSSRALQIAPDLIEARHNIGFSLIGKGRFSEAEEEYKKILLTQPQNVIAHSELGVALFQQDKLDEAIAHFNQAIQIDPNYTNAQRNLEIALFEKQIRQRKDTSGACGEGIDNAKN